MTLGERMKEYEKISKNFLMKKVPVIIRLDGRAFHTWTKGLDKPFDKELINIMHKTMLTLCNQIQGCVFGYSQSDEITLVLIDYQNLEAMPWFDNQVQKICSIAASIATSAFEKALEEEIDELEVNAQKYYLDNLSDEQDKCLEKRYLLRLKKFKANFDARAFNVPIHEVINNLIWRQQDAIRNSINSVAQSLYSHKELQGINVSDLKEKMLIEKKVNWEEDFSTIEKRGAAAIKDNDGKWFIDKEIPIFTENRDYINKLVYLESND